MEPTTETKQSEQTIIDGVLKLKGTYEQATRDTRQEIGDIYAAYMGKMENVKALPYKSQETIPKLRTEISYVKPFIFSGKPELEVEGIGDEDKAIAKILEKMVNWRLETMPNAYEKIEAWVHQAVTFGTSLIRVFWRFETEEQEGTGPDGQPYQYQTPTVDAPDIDVPNILDVYYNPIISDVKDQPCLIFRSVLTPEEVKENPAYDYVGEDGQLNREKVLPGGGFGKNPYDSTSMFATDIPNAQQKATDGMVEIFEKVDDDHITTIAVGGNTVVLRDKANPDGFIQAVKLIFEPNAIPNRFNGFGVGQNTLGMGKMYYQMWNQTLDNVKLTNNPMFLFLKGLGIDTRQLVAKPGGGIAVDAKGQNIGNVIQPLLFPDLKQGAMEVLQKMDDEHKRASGANDLVQGTASNATLGQDQIAQANISNRFELIQRRFKQCLADVGEMILKMEIKNLQSPDAEILRIFPEELRVQIYQVLVNEGGKIKFNIKVKGDTTVARNKDLESKRLIDLFNLAAGVQTPMGPLLTPEEMRAILRRIAERQGEQNIDEIISETQPQTAPQIDPMTGQPMQPGMQGGMQPINGQLTPMPQMGGGMEMNPDMMQQA